MRQASVCFHILVCLHGIDDKVCLFDLANVMHEGIEGSELIAFTCPSRIFATVL